MQYYVPASVQVLCVYHSTQNTPTQLTSNVNHNKIKLISTLCKQKKLTALLEAKFDQLIIKPSNFVKLRTLFGGQGNDVPV